MNVDRANRCALCFIVLCGGLAGCGYTRHKFGRPYQTFDVEPGRTTRTQVLEGMGSPQLFDMTTAGEIGQNYLVYEYRDATTWVITPIIINYANNTEKTSTVVFYFDEAGVLESVGTSSETPTTHRKALTFMIPLAIGEITK